MNNKSQVKNWIKRLVMEIKESINADETYNDYVIQADNLTIPNLSNEGDTVEISMNINYNVDAGHEERGQFEPPEYSVQGEEPSVEIVNAIPVTITVEGVETMVKSLAPEQIQVIKDFVANYLAENESEIQEKILSSVMTEERRPEKGDGRHDLRKTTIIDKFETKVKGELSSLAGQDFIGVKVVHIPEQTENLFIFINFKKIETPVLNYLTETAKKLRGEISMYYDRHKKAIGVKIVIPPLKHS